MKKKQQIIKIHILTKYAIKNVQNIFSRNIYSPPQKQNLHVAKKKKSHILGS